MANHLGPALLAKGHRITKVLSRNEESGKALAHRLESRWQGDCNDLDKTVDLVIVCVKDDAVSEVAGQISTDALVVHTSGATDMAALKSASTRVGVFYPLQTFSINKEVDWQEIPICVESNSVADEELLKELAERISNDVRIVSSEDRRWLHVAAVFACNFTNVMYQVADEILERRGLDLSVLSALINETAAKALTEGPRKAQTGPARRGDDQVLDKHRSLLKSVDPDLARLYDQLSELIRKKYE